MTWIISILLIFSPLSFSKEDHDHSKGGHEDVRPSGPAREGGGGDEKCPVSAEALSNFANGEVFDFGSAVAFVSRPGCIEVAATRAKQAAKVGINWSKDPKLRFDVFGNNLLKRDFEGRARIDAQLIPLIGQWLRDNPKSQEEMYSDLGQAMLLSETGARMILADIIQKQFYAFDPLLKTDDPKTFDKNSENLAKSLLKFGAQESEIAGQLADSIEEKAITAQADSLGKILRGLAAASRVENNLVPTFNLSAGAFNRGIRRAKKTLGKNSKKSLSVGIIDTLEVSLKGPETMEPGVAELNEALALLMGKGKLDEDQIKKSWKQIIQILARSSGLGSLADVIANSLTSSVLLVKGLEKEALFQAGSNYPAIALSLQRNFLESADVMYDRVHAGEIRVKDYNIFKANYLEPWAKDILSWESALIDPKWVRNSYRRGFLSDELVEKKMPKLVLGGIKHREKLEGLMEEGDLQGQVTMLSEGLYAAWANSTAYMPALLKWVQKAESDE